MMVAAFAVAYDLAVVRERRLRPIVTGTAALWVVAAATFVLKYVGDRIYSTDIALKLPPWSLGAHIAAVLSAYATKAKAVVWPGKLSVIYPLFDTGEAAGPMTWIGLVLVLATLAGLWFLRRRGVVLLGLLWYLLATAPTAQVLPHWNFHRDRFLYLPMVGVALAVAGALSLVPRRWLWMVPAAALGAAGVGAAALRAREQVPVWENAVTLFGHTVEHYPGLKLAHENLSFALSQRGRYAEAAVQARLTIEADRDHPGGYTNLGGAMLGLNRVDEAISAFRKALPMDPQRGSYRHNLAFALRRKAEALEEAAGRLRADGRDEAARRLRDEAAACRDEALRHLRAACQYEPEVPGHWLNRGLLLAAGGDMERAAACFEEAAERAPQGAYMRLTMGRALLDGGRVRDAVGHLEAARRFFPPGRAHRAEAARLLAWALAAADQPALRDGSRAVRLAREALETVREARRLAREAQTAAGETPETADEDPPDYLLALAAAYAEAGRFDDAVRTAERIRAMALRGGRADIAAAAEAHLALYRAGRPFRLGMLDEDRGAGNEKDGQEHQDEGDDDAAD
jgi:tetratricopeptide (TPR) repeat protein